MNIENLRVILIQSWSAETAQGDWDPNNPATGQCAITALIVQDYFGGELLRCKTKLGKSHYWNRLPDGAELDLTESQFEIGSDMPIKNDYLVRTREYVLSFPGTARRYTLLKKNIERVLTFKN